MNATGRPYQAGWKPAPGRKAAAGTRDKAARSSAPPSPARPDALTAPSPSETTISGAQAISRRGAVCGIYNVDSTCFFNAVLNGVASVDYICHHFSSADHAGDPLWLSLA